MRQIIHYIVALILIFIGAFILIRYSANLFYLLGLLIHILGIVIAVNLLLMDSRGTNSKVAWIALIFIVPILGVLSYLFFGRNPQKRKFSQAQQEETKKIIQADHHFESDSVNDVPRFSKEVKKLTGMEPITGNKVEILTNGDATFHEILVSLQAAKHHIHMQYYIFRTDKISTEIRDILIEKARGGVEVRFVYDDWGTRLNKKFLQPLLDAGAEIHAYDPVYSLWIARTANLRNHRKIIVIDGEIAFTGGLNVGEEYRSNTPNFSFWRDTHLKLEGPGVRELQESFLNDWVYMENRLGAADSFIGEASDKYFYAEVAGTDLIQVVYGGPYDKERFIRDSMLELISSAQESVWITSPYFVPDEEALDVVRRAARRGIDVKVIIPGKGDRGISFHGSNAYVETMIAAGAKIYAYDKDSFIHAKIVIVDGERVAIGTANFDVRSFRLNHELMVFLYGETEAVKHLIRDFETDLTQSTLLTEEMMKRKRLTKRLKEQFSRLLSPIL